MILGHSTTEVTLRYGHLVKGQFSEAERELAYVQLKPGKVLRYVASDRDFCWSAYGALTRT